MIDVMHSRQTDRQGYTTSELFTYVLVFCLICITWWKELRFAVVKKHGD